MRQILSILAAFTIGTLLATLAAERKSHDTAMLLEYTQGRIDAEYDAVHHVDEDMPGWDCATMGNKRCQ